MKQNNLWVREELRDICQNSNGTKTDVLNSMVLFVKCSANRLEPLVGHSRYLRGLKGFYLGVRGPSGLGLELGKWTAVLLMAGPLLAQQALLPPAEPEPSAQTEYGGPAILSRGSVASLRKPSEPIHFRPYVSFNTAFE